MPVTETSISCNNNNNNNNNTNIIIIIIIINPIDPSQVTDVTGCGICPNTT